MQHVSIIAIDKALGSSITIPLEMLSAANDIARARKQLDKINTIEVVGIDSTQVQLSGGLAIKAARRLQKIDKSDLIFVPGIWGNPRAAIRSHPLLMTWLQRQSQQGATICSITTGSYFLAEAGLLDGRSATTHWRYFDDFQRRYPKVKIQRKRFITAADNLYCTGSVNAARDLMLHFIGQLYDESIANEIARHFTHELKRSYESLLLAQDPHSTHHDETIIKVQEWLQNNFQTPVQLSTLATEFGMSVRSLSRRFKQASNSTPMQYLQEQRINHAKDLLKHSNLVISEVADRIGYHDASHFCELFKKSTAITPNEYRRLVRNKLFLAEGNALLLD